MVRRLRQDFRDISRVWYRRRSWLGVNRDISKGISSRDSTVKAKGEVEVMGNRIDTTSNKEVTIKAIRTLVTAVITRTRTKDKGRATIPDVAVVDINQVIKATIGIKTMIEVDIRTMEDEVEEEMEIIVETTVVEEDKLLFARASDGESYSVRL